MKKIINLLCLCLLMMSCQKQPLVDKETLKIVITSDIHYFLKDYYKDCKWFEENITYGDGKMVTYADEILDAFELKMKQIKPDLVIISGDLSFNGEIGSHQALAKRLENLEKEGISIAVIPGNHDVDNIFAKGYGKESYFDVESVNAKEFKDIYKNLGYDLSDHKHKDSLSYSIQLNEHYTLIMMDTTAHELTGNSIDNGGYLTDSSYQWLESELKSVQEKGKTPIVSMHHNLAIHHPLLNSGYTIKNHEQIAELLKNYQVPFVLSGHIHCQNIKEINGIYDIASSSLLDAPLQYGVMTLTQHQMNYETQSLKISVDANQYFEMVSNNRFDESFQQIENEKIRNEMKEVVAKANRYYFTGNIYSHIQELQNMKGYKYYSQEEGEKVSFYREYLKTMMEDLDNNQRLSLTYEKDV